MRTTISIPSRRLTACTVGSVFLALLAMSPEVLPAQTFTTLYKFHFMDGAAPSAGVVQAADGNFYGTTTTGGANSGGTVFKITPGGALSTVYSFCSQTNCTDGKHPYGGVIQALGGEFYGTTGDGGAAGSGTVFRLSPTGTLSTLYSFCSQTGCTDGANPRAGLVQAFDGEFWGTTYGGGSAGMGTVFKIAADGSFTTEYSFCSEANCTDGDLPVSTLVQAPNGDFYGTTSAGGAFQILYYRGTGTIFEIDPSGALTTLHRFCDHEYCQDGYDPATGLTEGGDGNLYGTANLGSLVNDDGLGTVFSTTPKGAFTKLYGGIGSIGAPAWGADGNLYGTGYTYTGYGNGVVYQLTPAEMLTALHVFCTQSGCPDGNDPSGALIQGTNGTFYGTTQEGGTAGSYGTVYSLSVGLGPFVECQRSAARPGDLVRILGTDLTGASQVTFNGTPAAFKVVSSSEIETTVPASATDGTVEVVLPTQTLSSSLPFTILP